MKIITNKPIIQKITIAIVIVILTTFCIPIQSQADIGGKLLNPVVNLFTAVLDGIQRLLESTMLGKSQSFMKEVATDYAVEDVPDKGSYDIQVSEFMDAKFWGVDAINIPTITYTPEEIFSNKVPALDINFIKPSIIKSADGLHDHQVQEKNIAYTLRGTIASWYNALTTIAMVGLLSVLVYLGIRMLLSSIAADRAKYKQMLMDWVVAMCLLVTLHFIMSFALTMVETVTAMLSEQGEEKKSNTSITVYATDVQGYGFAKHRVLFDTNLMSYVRFMIQAGDAHVKLGFLALYLMLVIYSVRFTWIYLKRVVNMAFLTLIAPMVALTYPIDKVSDGKAQAFNMWLKEFTYNALIQPIHLLLYKILLGSAITIAVENPLYAIVTLGFIIAAEKMVKQMFGFSKASGGTVASLAGAAGVTALAGKLLNNAGNKIRGAGGSGKVRTKDIPQRQGKDASANKPFQAFNNPSRLIGGGTNTQQQDNGQQGDPRQQPQQPEASSQQIQPPENPEQQIQPPEDPYAEQRLAMEQQLAQYDDTDPYFMDPAHQELQRQYQDLREAQAVAQTEQTPENAPEQPTQSDIPSPEEYNNPFEYNGPLEQGSFFDVVGTDVGNFMDKQKGRLGKVANGLSRLGTIEGKRNLKNRVKKGINDVAIGAWKATPAAMYKLGRGATRLGAAATMAGIGATIGATTGNGEQALSMAATAGGVGFASGDNIFDAVADRVGIRNPGGVIDAYKDAHGASKYGNSIDARNAKADKAYLKSKEFDEFYEKEFKNKYSREEFKGMVTSYRQSGITDQKDIKRAIKLEEYYNKQENNPHRLERTEIRKQVQNIVASYNELDSTQKRAFSGDEKAEKALKNEYLEMLGGDTEQNRQRVNIIFQGQKDFRTKT